MGDTPVARTAAGLVKARYLVLCGNAYLGNLLPEIRRKIMPVGTYVATTRPLGEDRARALIPCDAAVSDTKFVLDYYRRTADHRLLFGGRVSYTTLPPANLSAAMRRSMLAVFPDLADAEFEYVWGGNVAITVERTPHLGRIGANVYFAHGFSGMGVALTGVAGKVVAEAIAGTAERFDVFTRLPHSTFHGGRLFRTPMLVLAMLWYRIRDLL
jgi:gamma-glutamylputrescine oxidase